MDHAENILNLEYKIDDDVSIHANEAGSGDDVILLIHGFGDGKYVWQRAISRLSAYYKCVAVDLRGHGYSSWSADGEYAIELFCRDLLNVINIINPRKIALVGHSLGGEIALCLSQSLAGVLFGLVLVDFSPEVEKVAADRVLSDFLESLRPFSSEDDYLGFLRMRRILPDEDVLADIASCALRRDRDGKYRLRCDPRIAGLLESPKSDDAWSLLEQTSSSCLIIRGVGSAVLRPAVAINMKKALLKGQLVQIPMAGHSVMQDNPAAFEASIADYFCRFR